MEELVSPLQRDRTADGWYPRRRRWTRRSCTSSRLLVRRSSPHLQGHLHHSVLQRVSLLHVRAGCGLLNARVRTSKSTTARVTQSQQPRTTLVRVVRKAETWSYAAQQEGQLCNKGARANNIGTQAGSALTCSLLHKTQRQANHTNKKAMTSISLLPYNGGERFNTLYAGCA